MTNGMKVSFEATIDDFVDANNRILKRSKLVRRWRMVNITVVFLITGAVIYLLYPGEQRVRITMALSIAAISAAVIPLIHKSEVDNKLKKFLKEQMGSDKPVKVEVEISDCGLSVKQAGTMILHEWQNISSVESTGDAVELINKRGGITVVRSRAFRAPQEQERFADLARNFIKQNEYHPGIVPIK